MAQLPRPGIVCRRIRPILAPLVGWMGLATALGAGAFLVGLDPAADQAWLLVLAGLSSWVLRALVQRPGGQRPCLYLFAGAAAAAGIGALQGEALGPPRGIYARVGALAFTLLLAPAGLLAAIRATPGCEMRSYAHLQERLRGGDVGAVACLGWSDRRDHVRVLGR